jgi:hypothetical protein
MHILLIKLRRKKNILDPSACAHFIDKIEKKKNILAPSACGNVRWPPS